MAARTLFPSAKTAVVKCSACADTGLVELEGTQPARFAWQAFFTMMPCVLCDRGPAITPAFEQGREDYAARWERRR